MSGLKIERMKGSQVKDYINELAKLRMKVFREYPYLYDGNLEYEIDYLNTYRQCDESILVIANMDSNIIGVSTALPLAFEMQECKKPFLDKNIPISDIFYLGESVLLPEYRGLGIYRQFFQEREAAAKEYGSTKTTFCGVVREENDARRPKDFIPLDDVWRHFGYEPQPDLYAYYSWKEIDANEKTSKSMRFWMKNL